MCWKDKEEVDGLILSAKVSFHTYIHAYTHTHTHTYSLQAERMLNIARLDTEHTSEAKKAALEELDYATVSTMHAYSLPYIHTHVMCVCIMQALEAQ